MLRDDMCSCKNKVCAERVNRGFETWLKRNERPPGTATRQSAYKVIAQEYTKCMMSAMKR